MTAAPEAADGPSTTFPARWADAMIRFRWAVIALSLLVVAALGFGATRIVVLTDYREFFSPQNPELLSFEEFQATYAKTDNILFLVRPEEGSVFTSPTLSAIEALTERSWQIPFATRVDSLTNFQHTYALGDDLIVEDLIEDAASLSPEAIQERRTIARNEPLIRNLIVSEDERAAAVSVLIQLPRKDITELPAAFSAARATRDAIMADFPGVDVRISGISALNYAFADDAPKDMATFLPYMFVIILVLSIAFLRSLAATAAMLFIVVLSTVAAMGLAGYLGIGVSPVSAAAPIVILTLAIADCVHIMMSYRDALAAGLQRRPALVEAIRINFVAVSVTSITTVIGFLALNASDAPPFRALGNISALGIGAAWVLSLTLFPAIASFVPLKPKLRTPGTGTMAGLARGIIRHYRLSFLAAGAFCAGLIALIPQLEVNDEFTKYFDERVEFRRDTDVVAEYFGPLTIEYSIAAPGPGGVSDPGYLRMLEAFADHMRAQPKVMHVYAFTDIMKRLNRNMHGDNDRYHRIPEDRDLAAQYLVLYELSLPYGLDLNDRINIDKSASRVSIALEPMSTQETKIFLAVVEDWFTRNAPEIAPVGASAQIMFTYIADRNLESMTKGLVIAIILISGVMIFALRSVKLGLLSLVPNALPILSAFGVWAVINGEVGFAIAMVGPISLGIVVDDTVHFLTKFNLAQREKGLTTQAAIAYAFENVGMAILANTVILTIGFAILSQASFKGTVDLGILTALSIVLALVLGFLLLPALLLWIGGTAERTPKAKGAVYAR